MVERITPSWTHSTLWLLFWSCFCWLKLAAFQQNTPSFTARLKQDRLLSEHVGRLFYQRNDLFEETHGLILPERVPLSTSRLFAQKQIPVPRSRGEELIRDTEAGPPPDFPSILLENRIVYIGAPLVPQVTELVISQLLVLAYQSAERSITLYINSVGTNAPNGKPFSFDHEAFAIADTMLFIPCPIRTVCVGQAYGTAAMLLGIGKKGQRFALPNAQIMLHQPRARARGQAVDVAIKAEEVLKSRSMANDLLSKATGKDLGTIERDTSRATYLNSEEAVAYGLIDAVLYPGSAEEKMARMWSRSYQN